jgi:hypothetical protein
MPPLPRALAVAAVLAVSVLAPRAARAYPQWQLTTGAVRCNQCHYAPAGGGLINGFGRDAVGEQLSTFGGNGELLHGAVRPPRWLALGADLRGAFVHNDVQDPDGPTVAVFPMQADLSARVAFGAGISAVGIVGARGQIRNPDVVVPYQNYHPISTSRLISREHYLMWQPEATGPYLRAGRFYAPFGLRFPEHILYVRRDLGFDHLTETYNLSGGWTTDPWELHLTVFAPDFVRHIGSNEKGFAAYYERRLLDDRLAVGGQLRIANGPGLTRFIYGAVGKLYVESLRTMFLAEANGVQLVFADDSVPTRTQVVGAAGAAILPVTGLVITLLGEHNRVDLGAPAGWTAATALVSWFPYAHCEAQVMGRLQYPNGGDVATTVFAQLHYFF